MWPFDSVKRLAGSLRDKLDGIREGIANQADLQNRHLVQLNEQIASSNSLLQINNQLLESQNVLQRDGIDAMDAIIVLQRDCNEAIVKLTLVVDELHRAIRNSQPNLS